jgi:hypothetical protein
MFGFIWVIGQNWNTALGLDRGGIVSLRLRHCWSLASIRHFQLSYLSLFPFTFLHLPAFSLGLNLVVFIRAHRSPVSASSRFLMVSEGNNCLHSAGPVCFFDSGSAV